MMISSPTNFEEEMMSYTECPFDHKCEDCEYDCEEDYKCSK